jgi:GWxTD domain-containing protein
MNMSFCKKIVDYLFCFRQMRRVLPGLLLLLLSNPASAVQALTAHTVFYKKNADSSFGANVVICWQANATSVHFERNKDNMIEASLLVALRLSNDTGIVREESFVVKTAPKSSEEEALMQNISDQYEIRMPTEGHYELELVLMQEHYRNEVYEYKDTFTLLPLKPQQPFISGIQLIDTVFAATQHTVYSRNGHIELPAVSNYFDEQHNVLRYYAEIYDTAAREHVKLPLILNSYISYRKFAPPVADLERHDTLRGAVFVHRSFPLQALKSGNYYINMVLTDADRTVLDKRALFFQRFNPHPVEPTPDTSAVTKVTLGSKEKGDGFEDVNILDLTKTFVGKYTAAQVRAILKMLIIIAEAPERASIDGFLRKPDELYSKYFIYNFWEKRNKKNPEVAWKEYADKVREVNRLFSAGSRQGYETDRGRIYIKYGKPDDRILVPNEQGAMPYEIWQYYAMGKGYGNVVFLFYKSGKSIGNYELLHSTMIGETRNLNWRALLYSNSATGNGAVAKDSQAEQYIGSK